jgi:hypothetical protein
VQPSKAILQYLGLLFYHGKGVARSDEEAVKWFRLAVAQGEPEALLNLGWCLSQTARAQDFDAALRLFKRAAAKGNAAAAAEVERLAARSGRPA